MDGVFGLPELVIVLLIVLLIVAPKRLPRLGESLSRSFRSVQDDQLEGLYEYPVGVCPECQFDKGLRCRSCGRFTGKGGYVAFAMLVVLAVALVIWHVLVPVL